MERILVVSHSEQGAKALQSLIETHEGAVSLTISPSASDARAKVLDEDWDLVVVNTPMEHGLGEELVRMITEQSSTPVIMLVRDIYIGSIKDEMEREGVLVVSKPLIKELFWQALSLSRAMRARMHGMEERNRSLERKIEEIRMVDKAKWVLIRRGMDEESAHKYIERQAMDRRLSRAAIADEILNRGAK